MFLDRITFTGADDSTDPKALVELSEEFPIIEWGILFSKTKQGGYRFPSYKWMNSLFEVVTPQMRLSAHLCGRWVREAVLEGVFSWADEFLDYDRFQRVQLNFHGEFHRAHPRLREILKDPRFQFILQCDGVNDETARRLAADGLAVPLFDTSGGAGILPRSGWPAAWPGVYCGYAGGLGPDTVGAQVETISRIVGEAPFWIDMERRVRSEDDSVFDLEKVRAVLEVLVKQGVRL